MLDEEMPDKLQPETITIAGGGLVGALAAITLAQLGYPVEVYERRPDMRRTQVQAGRSINLAVSARGLLALEHAGLKQQVLDIAVPMPGRMVHSLDGSTTFLPYGQRREEVIYSVSRGELNKLLLQRAGEYATVNMHFDASCTGYESRSNTLILTDAKTQQSRRVAAARVLATDGSSSHLRRNFLQQTGGEAEQQYLEHGYKELSIPALPGGAFAMEKNALHIWPRQSYMLIALPNLDGSFTCTLFLQFEGEVSFASLETPAEIDCFFRESFSDALALMPDLQKEFAQNPTSKMVTVRCSPWHKSDKFLLLGDAAHAIVPFFGQGMNCGFEDCTALRALLSSAGDPVDWGALFAQLEAERKPNAEAIADMALENFIEMRDTVADPKFQLKKQVGFELERRHPRQFIPRYSMVAFHADISYAEAQRRGLAQDALLNQLTEHTDSLQQIDWPRADNLLRRLHG